MKIDISKARGEIFGVPVDFTFTTEQLTDGECRITVSWPMPPMEWDPIAGVLKVWPVPLEKSPEEEKAERLIELLW